MKRLSIAALWSACVMFAQEFTGNWQGTLQAGRELRVVIKITKADAGLKAAFYSIDQGSQALNASAVTVEGANLKILIPGVGGTYEGKLDEGGKSITGKWSQGPGGLPLNLTRAIGDAAWAIPTPAAPAKPMAADANPVFEVATIKPSAPDRPGKGFMVRGRQFSTLNTTLSDMISFAYGIHSRQVTGAPAWVEEDKFDLSATPDGEGQPNSNQWKTMLKKLIEDRFQFKFHREKKELSVYAIMPGKGANKLTQSESVPGSLPALFFRKLGDLPARNATMEELAGLLQSAVLDKPVVDQSGVKGRYDFVLSWTPDQFQFGGAGAKAAAAAAENASAQPDLFTAFEQQLGLKLTATKAPAEVFVVDKIEKPTAN